MPTKTRTFESRTELEQDREFEALGLGIAPGRGALSADPRERVIDRALDRPVRRRQAHTALGMPADRRISNEMIDELLAGASTEQEIAGAPGTPATGQRRRR